MVLELSREEWERQLHHPNRKLKEIEVPVAKPKTKETTKAKSNNKKGEKDAV